MYHVENFSKKMGERIIDRANHDAVIRQIDEKLALTDLWTYHIEDDSHADDKRAYTMYRCEFNFNTDIYISFEAMQKICDEYRKQGWRVSLIGNQDCTRELPGYALQFQAFLNIYEDGTVEIVKV